MSEMSDNLDELLASLSSLQVATLSKFAPITVIKTSFLIKNSIMAELFVMELIEIEPTSLRVILTDRGRYVLERWGNS